MRAALVLLLALAMPAAAAPEPGGARIVDAATLAAALGSAAPPLVLDARERRAFEAGHIPGSRRTDWRDFSEVRPGGFTLVFRGSSRWGLLAAESRLVPKLRALGVTSARGIVVVGSPAGWGEEGRIAWMLLYLGAEDVALLDGGFTAWERLAGAAVARGPAGAGAPGRFSPRPAPARRISREALQRALAEGSAVFLDARTREEFDGRTLRGQKRGGHLPGARLVSAPGLRTQDGAYLPADALRSLVGPLPRDARLVTYCTGGVRSALLAFLLEARLGLVAANYDGSLWEWSDDEGLPLVPGTPDAAVSPP